MNNRYQLIHPFISDTIYSSKSLLKSAKQCYSYLKTDFNDFNLDSIDTFTLLDIDSKEQYSFKIHTPIKKHDNSIMLPQLNDNENENFRKIKHIESDIIQLKNNVNMLAHEINNKKNNECIVS